MADSGPRTSTLVAAVAAGAIIGATAVCLWKGGATTLGDEPPIRVKNGSMHFDLDTGAWEEDARCSTAGGRKCWTTDTGESEGVFAFVIAPMPASCVPPAGSTIDKVTVTYSDGKKFSMKAGAKNAGNGKPLRTKIQPHGLLSRDAADLRRLSYGTPGTGYVTQIELDGDDPQGAPDKWTCRFTPDAPLVQACFTSTGDAAKCTP